MALFGDKTQVFVVNYPLDILMIIKSQRVKRALVAALADEEHDKNYELCYESFKILYRYNTRK